MRLATYFTAPIFTAGCLPVRVRVRFERSRKLGKTRQYVLIFGHGDVANLQGVVERKNQSMKTGRKEIVFDLAEVEQLGMLGATAEEMAAWFGVSTRSLDRRPLKEPMGRAGGRGNGGWN